MNSHILRIQPEQPQHDSCIEALNDEAFGPGRFARTAHILRAGSAHDPALSFVAMVEDNRGAQLVGSVRQTAIAIGNRPALLLGPLVVSPTHGGQGIGRELMHRTLHSAKGAGHSIVVLVGDLPYYSRFGFAVTEPGAITLPGPIDPARLLFRMLDDANRECYRGAATPYWQVRNTC